MKAIVTFTLANIALSSIGLTLAEPAHASGWSMKKFPGPPGVFATAISADGAYDGTEPAIVGDSGDVYQFDGDGANGWVKLTGHTANEGGFGGVMAEGWQGFPWMVDDNGSLWGWSYTDGPTGYWYPALKGGCAVDITVAEYTPWLLGCDYQSTGYPIYQCVGKTTACDTVKLMPGQAAQLSGSATDGSMWMIDGNNLVNSWTGSAWSQIKGLPGNCAAWVAAVEKGYAVAASCDIASNGNGYTVYEYKSKSVGGNGKWTKLSNLWAYSIAVGGSNIYSIDFNGDIYKWACTSKC